MFNLWRNNRGIGILPALILGSVVAITGYYIIHNTQLQQKAILRLESETEFKDLQREIIANLNNYKACNNSFVGTGNLKKNDIELNLLKDKDDLVAFRVGITYANRIKIQSIKLRKITEPVLDVTSRVGQVDIKIINDLNISKNISIPLHLNLNEKFNVESCFSGTNATAMNTLISNCLSIGGKLKNGKCDLVSEGTLEKILISFCAANEMIFNLQKRRCVPGKSTKITRPGNEEKCRKVLHNCLEPETKSNGECICHKYLL